MHTAKRAREAFEQSQQSGAVALFDVGVEVVLTGPFPVLVQTTSRRDRSCVEPDPYGSGVVWTSGLNGNQYVRGAGVSWADAPVVWGSVAAPGERAYADGGRVS